MKSSELKKVNVKQLKTNKMKTKKTNENLLNNGNQKQKFNMKYIKFKNLVFDWGNMGITNEEFNDGEIIIKNGKIWGKSLWDKSSSGDENTYSEYCLENVNNYTKEEITDHFFGGDGYECSLFYRKFCLLVESGELELFNDLDEIETIKIK